MNTKQVAVLANNLKRELARGHSGNIEITSISKPMPSRVIAVFEYSYDSTISKTKVVEMRAACVEIGNDDQLRVKWDMIVA